MEAVAGASVLVERMDLKPGMRVLDVGCGPGRLTIPLAKHVGPTARVTAFDIQERMLQYWREDGRQARQHRNRARKGRRGRHEVENVFDRAVLVTVLGEIPKKDKALRNLSEPSTGRNPVRDRGLPIRIISPQARSRLATEAGFEIESRHGHVLAFTLNLKKPGLSAE